jgi:predicted alpha/beta-hydrolase family hydrolase
VSDHPIIVPTAKGPVGAIVTEPGGEPRGGLVLFQGGGPPARCGVNAIWTRIAHDLAALGLLVLRFDFACEAESTMVGMDASQQPGWRSALDMPVTREVSAWFRERAGLEELMVAGSCYGARLALELAAEDRTVKGTFLVTPYLAGVRRARRGGSGAAAPQMAVAVRPDLQQGVRDPLSAVTVDAAKAIAERQCPFWMLIGEHDGEQALELESKIGSEAGGGLTVEVAPGIALHPGTDAPAQKVIASRLRKRIAQQL